ncbi:calponin homology domain protein [Aspergillus clavatus NRRL 1]|uniref:Transgelin, putative n=1 Tax=Aspergillus clavatus (strain ATCC 1007 / CBS 513.65 / DSM 816 / NCTC 3887 / NRRL 1 / QM 1276 / 107) TaxID=344612 RepID=A1CIP5_ASPCL|nr:transgelin, putative [Aspergillus clavatus NRRL 1]EAW10750.1 transgelin, putative [Aspergillus clavatus NRRL 1]
MASVTSLDKDLRNLRLSRYTPQAAAEVREWIEETLHERLPAGDLLDALKDGVALCRLVNLAVSPGVKYKQSSMPFVQMENISHFLRACQIPPLSLPPHDVFLTVDLYESKDPAQVLQCLMAFSRRANALQPTKFLRTIGVQSKGGTLSPHLTGSSQSATTPRKSRGLSNVSDRSGTSSPAKSPAAVSSWSKKSDEHATMPAWNIHQYGYMGGASQGNQGVAFGARRQITTPSPLVPSLEEKERRRREEEERQRTEKEESERLRQQEREAEEAHAKAEEERRWEEETARLKEVERRRLDEERQQWDEQQRKWEEEERKRQQDEKEAEEKLDNDRQRRREGADALLTGQFLSQYQAKLSDETRESQRIKQLERELELAKEREFQYQRERQDVQEKQTPKPRSPRPVPVPPKPSYDLSSLEQERRMLRTEWQKHQPHDETAESSSSPPPIPPRALPEPTQSAAGAAPPTPSRPLPDPATYTTKSQAQNSRVDRFLASNRPPVAPKPATHRPQDYTTTAEVDEENSRRIAAQQKTRAGGWASKSLLEREMERERERQREWEESQKQTRDAAAKGLSDSKLGVGPGQGAWDVHQYGFMGGDNQNRGGPGLGVGGARRQIIGPRPPR